MMSWRSGTPLLEFDFQIYDTSSCFHFIAAESRFEAFGQRDSCDGAISAFVLNGRGMTEVCK